MCERLCLMDLWACVRVLHTNHPHPPAPPSLLQDGKIVIEKKGERSKTWDDFMSELPNEDCRYVHGDNERVGELG